MGYLDKVLRSVSPYDPAADREALREFQRAHFGENARQLDDAFSDWLFARNPLAGEPSLWVSKRDGVVVGQQGAIPVMLKVDEVEHRAAWLIDLMVHPDWRLKGIGPALLAAARTSAGIFLGVGIEDDAHRALIRGGWKDVGFTSYFVRPIDPRACGTALNAPALATRLAPRALFSGSAAIAGVLAGAATRTELETVPHFDERVDAIWAAANRDYPIAVKRDFAHVKWRFDDTPERGRYTRYYLRRKGVVIGYAVARARRWNGYDAANVVDYFAPRRALGPLFALLFRALAAERAVAVFMDQLHAGSEATLKALGCVRVRASQRVMCDVADRESPLAARLGDAGRWFITPADSDMEHIALAVEARAVSPPVKPA